MQSKLVILDREIGKGLARYMMSRNRLMSVVLCDSLDAFLISYGDGKESIGIIEKEYYDKSKGRLDEKENTLFILEERVVLPGTNRLHRYQTADQLLKRIYTRLMESGTYLSGTVSAAYNKQIIAICSPHGMSLQTQIAFIYAILSAKKVKTLFLSFSFFCGYFGNDRNGDNLDLGDLFYQMKKGAGAGLAIESMVHTVGRLDYISPVARQMDLEDIDADDLAGLIGRLLAESDYEAIVVDLPPRPSFLRAVCHLTSQLFCLKHEGEVYDNSAARLVSHIQDASKDQVTTITEIVVADRTEARMLDVDNTEEILNSRLADFVKREMWKKHDRL